MKNFLQHALLCCALTGAGFAGHAQAPYTKWACPIAAGGGSYAVSRATAIDAAGNVYTTGHFQGTPDFDPGAGVVNMTSAGLDDAFVCKFDASGAFQWARQVGGTGYDVTYSIAVDSSGFVYVAGEFDGTVDFDPGAGVLNKTSAGINDAFVTKLNPSGNLVWSATFGGSGEDAAYSLTVDAAGNVFSTGYFEGTADFDPGVATANLTGAGNYDIFVSKLDASGNYLWARGAGGTSADVANGIAVDASGSVFATGSFRGTADFDPGAATANRTSNGLTDVFILKLDASGNYLWVNAIGGTAGDNGFSLAVDATGNVHAAGYFLNTADFDPGAGTVNLSSAGSNDIFIAKYDGAGNYLWAKSIGSTSGDMANGIAVDANNNIYATGFFMSTPDFDPGAGTATMTSSGATDIFILKLDQNGDYLWAKKIGSTTSDIAYGIAADGAGNIITAGHFSGTADFDPGPATLNLSGPGQSGFVLKWSECLSNTLPTNLATATLSTILINGNYQPLRFSTSCTDVMTARPAGASPVTGAITGAVFVQNSAPTANGHAYVRRHYDITPASGANTATATVTLYFSQQDFDDYNANNGSDPDFPTNATDVAGIANIRIRQEHGVSPSGLPGTYTGWAGAGPAIVAIDPVDAAVVYNTTLSRWEISFDITGFSGFFLTNTSNGVPLAAELLSFDARAEQAGNMVSWKTGVEDAGTTFVVERSLDARTFATIGSLQGKGSNSSYTLPDESPAQMTWYRLKSLDVAGKAEYSAVVAVRRDAAASGQVTISPVPATNFVQISTTNPSLLGTTGVILDAQGRELNRFILKDEQQISVQSWPAGIYLIRLADGSTSRIVKQ